MNTNDETAYTMDTITLFGSAGVALLLIAFFLNQLDRLSAHAPAYLLMNAVGSFLAGYASLLLNFLPFVLLEWTWTLVALLALFRKRKKAADQSAV